MAMRDNKSPLAADAVLAMKCRRDNRVTLSSFISDESLCLDRSKLPCGYHVRKHPHRRLGPALQVAVRSRIASSLKDKYVDLRTVLNANFWKAVFAGLVTGIDGAVRSCRSSGRPGKKKVLERTAINPCGGFRCTTWHSATRPQAFPSLAKHCRLNNGHEHRLDIL
jgi:hypothetical protein